MSSPLISICIPAYNALRYIPETLEAITKQTYTNWELIVVEDGSDDGTEEIIEQFINLVKQNVIYFRNPKNVGLAATRNVASKMAAGNWIAYLDSDDLWLPNHLADLIKTSLENEDYDLIHSGTNVFNSDNGEVTFKQELTQQIINQFPVSLYNRSYGIQPSSVMISKRLFYSTGGFNETLGGYGEDIEMWFKSAKAGFRFAYTGNNTCYYRKVHGAGLTSNSIKMTLGTAKVYDAYYGWDAIPLDLRKSTISNSWLNAAKMLRKTNLGLAICCLKNTILFKYK